MNKAVNTVFLAGPLPETYQFSEQTTLWKAPPTEAASPEFVTQGEAQLLPLIERVEKEQP